MWSTWRAARLCIMALLRRETCTALSSSEARKKAYQVIDRCGVGSQPIDCNKEMKEDT